MSDYKVKRTTEKGIGEEGTVDGKSYPLLPPPSLATLPRAAKKKKSTASAICETDGGEEPRVKAKVVLLSKGEGWTLKLPKHHKYRVVLIQEKSSRKDLYEVFASNDYSSTKDAFNSVNLTLSPLWQDGSFYLEKKLLKQVLLPQPLPPDKICSHLVEVMEKEPGIHTDWQAIVQKLTEPTSKKTKRSNSCDEESGLASLKRKFNKKETSCGDDKRLSVQLLQADLSAAHLVAVPEVSEAASGPTDDETSEEVWTLFRKGTLRAYKDDTEDKSKTWLLEACEKQYLKSCLKLIQSHVVDVNDAHPKTGDTALHVAVRSGNIKMVKLLLAYKADPTVLNACKESPYDAAKKLECSENADAIIKVLEQMKRLQTEAKLYYAQNSKLPKRKSGSGPNVSLLSLDGGGMRSVIMCHILTAVENRMKELRKSCNPLQSYFDYIAGTSAGSIIGALLLYANIPVPLAEMYLYKFMVDVFGSQKSERTKKLKGFLTDILGAERKMCETNGGRMIVTTTLANVRPNQLHLMTSYGEARDKQLGPDKRKVWEALVASAAAPTYFPAFESFLDGGLMANNPTLPAMSDIVAQNLQHTPKKKAMPKISCVVSLGTGYVDPPQPVENFEVFVPGFSKDIAKNLFQSSMGLVSLLSHFVEQTTQSNGEVVKQAEMWCGSLGASYFRLSPPMKEEIAPDIKHVEKFISLIYETEIYALQQCSSIDGIAKLLLTK